MSTLLRFSSSLFLSLVVLTLSSLISLVTNIFESISNVFIELLLFTKSGAEFLFGVTLVNDNTFGATFAFEVMPLGIIFVVLGAAAVLSTSVVAIFQDDIKRMLAYSSVAQIGYMILGISMSSVAGLTASIVHLFNHALMKGGLFLALGCIAYQVGGVRLGVLAGSGYRIPWTMAAFLIGSLSLIGVPLTAGFISKWLIIQASLERGWWPILVVVIIGSLLSVVYVWRVLEMAYLRRRLETQTSVVTEAPLSLLVPTWILITANVYFGIDTGLTVGIAEKAASVLMANAP